MYEFLEITYIILAVFFVYINRRMLTIRNESIFLNTDIT
jgi:cell division protein FtsL